MQRREKTGNDGQKDGSWREGRERRKVLTEKNELLFLGRVNG